MFLSKWDTNFKCSANFHISREKWIKTSGEVIVYYTSREKKDQQYQILFYPLAFYTLGPYPYNCILASFPWLWRVTAAEILAVLSNGTLYFQWHVTPVRSFITSAESLCTRSRGNTPPDLEINKKHGVLAANHCK